MIIHRTLLNISGMKVRFYVFAVALFSFCSCSEPINKTAGGALTGSALGAGLGAIVGSTTHQAGPGIAIGAAAGALGGALVGNSLEQTDREHQRLSDINARQRATLEENRKLIEELRRRGADVSSSERGVVINLPDVLFEFDKASLTREAGSTVREIASVLRGVKDRSIAVEGHTDSVGSAGYNQRLSERRAYGVADTLSADGIPHNQMRVKGFGKDHPIASNSTPEGRARNRRVEVIVENR